jgi:hypothetical protein
MGHNELERLSLDFRLWGRTAVKRIVYWTKKVGVIASDHIFSRGGKG